MSTDPRLHGTADETADEFTWLEETRGERALAWVDEQNAVTTGRFCDADFDDTAARIRGALDSEDRIPAVAKRGEHYYNLWRDAAHPRGLWRRTTWESYLTDAPEWDVLLDLDALSAEEGTAWVWAGAAVRRSDFSRALISLSPDGGDAHRVREFDLVSRTFVDAADGGFDLPTGKTGASWCGDDSLLVAADLGGDTVTTSSYPRQIRLLDRGGELADAPVVREIPTTELGLFAAVDHTPGFERALAIEAIDFHRSRHYVCDLAGSSAATSAATVSGGWTLIDVPETVDVGIDRELLLLRPQEDCEIAGTALPAGSLAVCALEDFLTGEAAPQTVFAPDARTSLESWSLTRGRLLLTVLADVQSEVRVLDRTALLDGGPEPRMLSAVPENHTVSVAAVDPDDDATAEDFWMTVTGFLTPTTLMRGTLSDDGEAAEPALIKSAPAMFDADGLSVTQHFAVSADGTRVPYFQVGPEALGSAGGGTDSATDAEPHPVLLDGYGGFEVSRLPAYAALAGIGWLSRRTAAGAPGVYVVANIRGGGEYGPSWHRAALRENRHRAYEDFVAVARDLVARGVTRPELLACSGGSNGGLLVGNMLTQFPADFGAVSCGVPLLDMKRYVKLSAGTSWIAEYGDPDTDDWEFIRTFSPYHLLEEGREYPPVLFWTATSDDRVGPEQARKTAARMQALGAREVFFYEDRDGGHSAAADNEQAARTRALSYRFLWKALTGE